MRVALTSQGRGSNEVSSNSHSYPQWARAEVPSLFLKLASADVGINVTGYVRSD